MKRFRGYFQQRSGSNFCVLFQQAYHLGMFSPKYVWVFYGYFSPRWWAGVRSAERNCSDAEMLRAVEGYLSVVYPNFGDLSVPTISGKVSRYTGIHPFERYYRKLLIVSA